MAGLKDEQKPTVFLEAHAGNGPDCCNSVGAGNIGDYLTFVGGRNIGAEVLKQPSGKLNLEFVVERDPDLYIAHRRPASGEDRRLRRRPRNTTSRPRAPRCGAWRVGAACPP